MLRLLSCLFTFLSLMAWAMPGHAADTPPPTVDFVRDVRPILAARCFACHGADAQEGELRLDLRESALRGGTTGAILVPGRGGESALIERVTSTDEAVRMPQEGQALTAEQIDILKRWIDEGANWPDDKAIAAAALDHWSLKPLFRPSVPSAPDATPANPIDAFVRDALGRQNLKPSPEADRRTLIRRLSFDLTGLPPTPEEVASFVADPSPQAYEQLVDRLLASPRYGERWARHWIDVAHWAETHGHDQDRPRANAWHYRDYLIRSFNDDKPYARFVGEQVAGDALYPGDSGATVALGFLAAGPWDESSLMCIQDNTLDRLMGQVLDRDDMITNVMSTFCGATVHCARCHDHKFDPISQADYYSLQAVFAGVDRVERPFDAEASTGIRRGELDHRKIELQSATAEWLTEPEQQALAIELESRFNVERHAWQVIVPFSVQAERGSAAIQQADGSLLYGGERRGMETYTLEFEGEFDGTTAVRLEVLTDPSLPHNGPGRQDNGNLHLSEFELSIAAAAGGEPQRLEIAKAVADFNQADWDIARAIDGMVPTAWGIHPEVGKPHAAVFVLREPIAGGGKSRLKVVLKQLHGDGHLIGRPRLSVTRTTAPHLAAPWPTPMTALVDTPLDARTAEQKMELARHLLGWQIDHELAALPAPQYVYAVASRAASNGKPIAPPAEPRKVHVLRRGDITQPLDEAAPGTLSCVSGLESKFAIDADAEESVRRAALAHWLVDPNNPLTWRTIANRVWHHHFGCGIVDTPNDLGKMGGTPSHPELLDWLAVEFRDSGGSLKRLHRLIVTSETYRQSSQSTEEFARIDGNNRLLWRMNATRLDAESIRDAVLQVSGKLDLTMGGPSVKQFVQSPGIHVTPNVDYQALDIDDPTQFRRSIYRFLFRTLPDPFMASMDCPDASQWAPTRNASVTALQALTMLNNRFITRQSEHVATRLAGMAPDPAEQIRLLFQLAVSRDPDADESRQWQDYAARHGLANACRIMFNTNEFMFVR